MPDLPGSSSALPTLYHTMWVTMGARRSGMTTTSSPLSRVKLTTSVSAGATWAQALTDIRAPRVRINALRDSIENSENSRREKQIGGFGQRRRQPSRVIAA
ncbi:hypothetical protein D3C72_1682010 [compost metagenome]